LVDNFHHRRSSCLHDHRHSLRVGACESSWALSCGGGKRQKKRGRRTATATAAEFCKTRQLPIKFANDVKSLAGNYVAGARRTEGQCRHWRGPHHETAGGRGSTADLSLATRNPTEASVYSPFLRVGIVPGRISRNSTGRIGRNSTGRRRLPAGRGTAYRDRRRRRRTSVGCVGLVRRWYPCGSVQAAALLGADSRARHPLVPPVQVAATVSRRATRCDFSLCAAITHPPVDAAFGSAPSGVSKFLFIQAHTPVVDRPLQRVPYRGAVVHLTFDEVTAPDQDVSQRRPSQFPTPVAPRDLDWRRSVPNYGDRERA
jgi:hypothetical protein